MTTILGGDLASAILEETGNLKEAAQRAEEMAHTADVLGYESEDTQTRSMAYARAAEARAASAILRREWVEPAHGLARKEER